MSGNIDFELTQKIIDAIEQTLTPIFANEKDLSENFNLEQFVGDVQKLVPGAPADVIVAYLQLYLTPMGEGEDDFFMGEDFGEDFGANQFGFALDEDQTQE